MRDGLAGGGELGGGAERRGLGRLAAGVGVDLGVEHQDVDVAAAWPARGRGRRSRCRRPSRRRRRSRRSSSPGSRRACSSRRASGASMPPSVCLQGDDALALGRDAGLGRLVGLEQRLRPGCRRAGRRAARRSSRGLLACACRRPAACRGRTRRCPRTASWTRPGRGRRGRWCRASSAGCRRRSTSSRWRWRSAARSPKSWVSSLM